MKKLTAFILLLALTFTISFGQDNPVIVTIDGKEIRKDEFLSIYTKNNKSPKYDKESLDEYMELFVKFKLKVTEAEELKYDTIPRLKNELDGYINKSAEKYLRDSSASESLLKEAYERKKMEVKASHILFTGNDAYQQAMNARKEILKSGDFEAAALKYSKDPSVIENKGSLGYFSVFQMVLPFEEAAYKTKVGDISQPIKTRFGYHLIKVFDKRKNQGRIKVAHIYTKIPKDSDVKATANAKAKIDEIYKLLNSGSKSFEELAIEYSDDQTSAKKGGELPWFTSGRMVPEFETVAFSLKNKNDISEPFLTSYGYHIIKKLDQEEIASYEKLRPELESNIKRGERSKKSAELFVEKLKKQYRFKDKSKKWMKNSFDAKANGRISTPDDKVAYKFKSEPGLFKKSTKVRVSEFKDFLRKTLPNSQADVESLYKDFVTNSMMEYERSTLYNKYPEYKALMQEFKDGILLFEISDDKVWGKSNEDTTGLKYFFNRNKIQYQWKERYDIELYSSAKKITIYETYVLVKDSNKTMSEVVKKINKSSQLNLTAQQGVFESGDIETMDKFEKKEGISDIMVENGKFIFVKINKIIPAGDKELKDARGKIQSDYQKYLEEEWIKNLKSRYKVEINKVALYSLGK